MRMPADFHRSPLVVFLLLAIVVVIPCALSQAIHPESLLLSPGDLVHLTVFDIPELEQHIRVTDSGEISVALVGFIKVAGIPPFAAAGRVSDALAAGGFVRHAQVTVLVEQFASADISVSGQVQHPGTYPISAPRNLIDVLSMAGGLTPAADIHITIRRRGARADTVYATLPNDADAALLSSTLVYPGDLVIVPKAGIVYVLGDVARPGGYVMNNDAELTVMQVIALASGTTKTAGEGHARLIRQTTNGPQEVPLHLKQMEQGTAADIPLRPADVLYIPYSTGKNIMLGASSILSSAGGAAIYAAK